METDAMSDEAAARKAQLRAIFDRIAPDYDVAGPGCFAYFGRRLVEVVGVDPGQRVLDVATGRGAVLIPAAEHLGGEGEAVGVDLAEGMVRLAREEVTRRGLAARLEVMDAEQLGFPQASFDRVLCGFGAMFFPNLERALSEFHRVLKPGGRLGVSAWRITQADDLGAVLVQLGLMPTDGDPALRFKSPEQLERPVVAAGFRDVRVLVDAATFRYADVEQYWQSALGTGLRRWLDLLNPAQLEQVRAALNERLRLYERSDGIHLTATASSAVAVR